MLLKQMFKLGVFPVQSDMLKVPIHQERKIAHLLTSDNCSFRMLLDFPLPTSPTPSPHADKGSAWFARVFYFKNKSGRLLKQAITLIFWAVTEMSLDGLWDWQSKDVNWESQGSCDCLSWCFQKCCLADFWGCWTNNDKDVRLSTAHQTFRVHLF